MKLTIIRKQLKQEYQQLEQELRLFSFKEDVSSQSQESGNSRPEDASMATNDFERRVALEKQKISHLLEIERSLQKLETGSYGVCDKCSQPIEQGRLEALPYAILCIQCKTAAGNRNGRGFTGKTR